MNSIAFNFPSPYVFLLKEKIELFRSILESYDLTMVLRVKILLTSNA